MILIVIRFFQIRLVCKGEETNRVTNNIETPPTTPDSFKNTLTTSAANMVDGPKSTVALDDTKVFAGSNINNEAVSRQPSNSTNVSHLYCLKFLPIYSFAGALIAIIYTNFIYNEFYRMKVRKRKSRYIFVLKDQLALIRKQCLLLME